MRNRSNTPVSTDRRHALAPVNGIGRIASGRKKSSGNIEPERGAMFEPSRRLAYAESRQQEKAPPVVRGGAKGGMTN